MKRYGVSANASANTSGLPFAKAVEADGWLYVSGQTPTENGEVVGLGIVHQTHKTIENLLSILEEAGYRKEDIVRCGVWLEDGRDFASFNKVYREYFGDNPPARACVLSSMVFDCKVEIDCIAFNPSKK